MRAADVTARLLEAWGFNIAFGVPGESYLALLDALHDTDGFRFINCRQEGGAAMAAEAHARATGKPGLVMVTRGPGLTNASAGIHVAQQGSTPLIVLIGMPARETERRNAFQELDIQGFGQVIGKEALIIRDPHRIAEQLSHAVHLAISGRPGPVLVGLPEDMLTEEAGDTSDALLCSPFQSGPARFQPLICWHRQRIRSLTQKDPSLSPVVQDGRRTRRARWNDSQHAMASRWARHGDGRMCSTTPIPATRDI